MVAAKEFALILGGAVASILASIHRAAEKGCILGNPHSPGLIAPGP